MAERAKPTANRRQQYMTSEARARAVILRRRANWPGQPQIVPQSEARYLRGKDDISARQRQSARIRRQRG